METAALVAPEVDRLVISINRRIGAVHGERLRALAGTCGLENLGLLPSFAEFILAGRLTPAVATLRMRYHPAETVLTWLGALERSGLTRAGADGLAATGALRELAEEIQAAQAEVAADTWRHHEASVATAADLARRVADACSDEHVVAVVHRALPDPAGSPAVLVRRLTTLRYVRQHDHAAAWTDRGLTAAEVVVLTTLWHGEPVEGAGDVPAGLAAKGLTGESPLRLTPAGLVMREEIEADTNRRAQRSFDVLGEAEALELLSALRDLPAAP
jgi:hypothetical protein